MTQSQDPSADGSQETDERRPLLSGDNHGTTERRNGQTESGAEEQDAQETPLAQEPDTRKLFLIFGSMWTGAFMNAVDSTIVATLSAPISNSFNSFQLLSWLATAYLISNAALQPLTGKLTDIYGRRAGLVWSNIFFAAGNLICGLANSQRTIIAGRVVAGLGGGGVNSISAFVASDLVPLRRRGLFTGYGNILYGLGSGLGAVLGGWINDSIGWRWAFLIQVPVILISATLAFFFVKVPVKETSKSRIRRVDFLGAATLVATLVSLLLALNSGGNVVPWTHPLVLVSLPLSLLFFIAFIYIEDRVAAEPIIPVRLCLHATVAAACLANWFGTMAAYVMLFYGPIFFQVTGLSATQAGARLIPNAVGISLGSVGCGWVMRKTGRYWWLNVCMQVCMVAAGVLLVATMDQKLPVVPALAYFFLMGLGYGGMLTTTLLSLISAVDHEHQAVITSASYAFRSTGSTIGITIASAAFQNPLKTMLWSRFGDWEDAAKIIPRVRDNINEIKNLPADWKEGVIKCYVQALRGVWATMLGLALLSALVSLFIREHKLHTTLARK